MLEYAYYISFWGLVFISIFFNAFKSFRDSNNVFIYAFRVVPVCCAFMSLICWQIWELIAFILSLLIDEKALGLPNFLLILFGVPLLIFILSCFVFRYFAKLNYKKYIYLSFALVFMLSGAWGISVYSLSLLNDFKYRIIGVPFYKLEVENAFYFESQRLPALCAEYNLRISFKSGKFFNIHVDTCGASDFKLYKLKDGRYFMQGLSEFLRQASYIVDTENELVYYMKWGDSSIYKLHKNKITNSMALYKPMIPSDNKESSYYKDNEDIDGIFEDMIFIGDLNVHRLKK